jgi:2Fe-2S ferredoxin
MPKVVIESFEARSFTIEAPKGGALVDYCDEYEAPVPFSCKSASCGTCRIDILEGGNELLPPADEELDILDLFGDKPASRRLACQAQMKPGMGLLRIRPVGD